MKLSLKNIGKIDTASVEINGITVIAGENNTGKSTVGKALFSIFNSFYDIENRIYLEKVNSIRSILNEMSLDIDGFDINKFFVNRKIKDISEKIVSQYENNTSLKSENIYQIIREYFNYTIENKDDIIMRIIDILNVQHYDILKTVLEKNFNEEFNSQINNIFFDNIGKIELSIKETTIEIEFEGNRIESISNEMNLNKDIIYIDDPFILDNIDDMIFRQYYGTNHQIHLKEKLNSIKFKNSINIIDEIVVNNRLDKIYEKINLVCDGDIIKNNSNPLSSDFGYKKINTDKYIDLKNLSTGLKTFVILKMLLLNGILVNNGTIILDEPEIHLHPEWQLLFAEIIVLIHKEFNMHILLNTHSPYFLRAIQVYSSKHNVADKCKYYLSENKGDIANIFDVTDDIEKIYEKLSRPLQRMEDERWQDEHK